MVRKICEGNKVKSGRKENKLKLKFYALFLFYLSFSHEIFLIFIMKHLIIKYSSEDIVDGCWGYSGRKAT